MSLGWCGESALLPKAAKKIEVDGRSMLSLNALVYEQEQRLESAGGASLRKRRGQQHARVQASGAASRDPFSRSNHGVRERDERDSQAEQSKKRKHAALLHAKAELYDRIATGRATGGADEFLVDFSRKPDSEAAEADPASSVGARAAAPRDAPTPQWAWSCGDRLAADAPPTAAEAINAVLEATSEPTAGPVAGAARVLSQWEKTLRGDEKEHLDQIRAQTVAARANAPPQSMAHVDRKEARRELLRQQLARRRGSGSAGSDPIPDIDEPRAVS